ncbi:MAG TPA: DNA-3-methyladenine glycosylase [Opitutaceae bacterium]|nr:DNA-3-methyladenine glycosylase [Opitutaceae bacterium]
MGSGTSNDFNNQVLPPDTWASRATLAHARSLLGKVLVRTREGRETAHVITEVEAYIGERDLACHASAGRTPRTAVMFGPPSHWYVYLVYGMHEMLNLVTGPEDWPSAILIRGVAGVSGPGRVTRALAVDRGLNGKPVARSSGLHIEDRGIRVPDLAVVRTPRIGVDYAGAIWSAKPWRFVVEPAALGVAVTD